MKRTANDLLTLVGLRRAKAECAAWRRELENDRMPVGRRDPVWNELAPVVRTARKSKALNLSSIRGLEKIFDELARMSRADRMILKNGLQKPSGRRLSAQGSATLNRVWRIVRKVKTNVEQAILLARKGKRDALRLKAHYKRKLRSKKWPGK